jgi:hypothetical protein
MRRPAARRRLRWRDGGRLSADEYRAELAIGKEAARAEAEVEKGLHTKTLGELRHQLDKFAAWRSTSPTRSTR